MVRILLSLLSIEPEPMNTLLKFGLFGALLVLTGTAVSAQSQDPSHVEPCGHHNAEELLFLRHPETRFAAMEAERQLERETELQAVSGQREELLIIPIVFHIIHNNGPENISSDQVHDAVEVLNTNLRALNDNIDQVIPEFEDLVADIEIEFRLAQRDPNGNCHPGINRIVSDLTYVGNSEMKSLIQWPRNRYLNVWVCDYANGAAGYALYPSSVNNFNSAMDGIVLQHTYCGSIGTANVYRSRTLTHEVGHWLNLRHPWGDSNEPGLAENCGDDDLVSDTPNTVGWTNCNNVYGESCGTLDNVQNFMDYSYCGRMFTLGQKARMRSSALSSVAQRNQLSTPANLSFTGVAGEGVLCEAVFTQDRRVICAGDSIQFVDASFHNPTTWTWDFGDGTVLEGTAEDGVQSVHHTYTQPGMYDVTLTVGNGVDEVSQTIQDAAFVMGAGEMDVPMTQGFEVGEFPDPKWFVEDALDDGTWELTWEAAATGSRSMFIENWGNSVELNQDFLRTATMDMSGMEEIHVAYKWAYVHKGTDEDDATDDRLRISVTGDCGNDWDLRRMHRGFTDLPSDTPFPFPWTPGGEEDWNSSVIVLGQDEYMTERFRLQFEFESRLGNNIYLDDINVQGFGVLDVSEAASATERWTLYPNPSSATTAIVFHTPTGGAVAVSVKDASGREVHHQVKDLPAGAQEWPLDVPASRGVYFVSVETESGLSKTWRWAVQ